MKFHIVSELWSGLQAFDSKNNSNNLNTTLANTK